MFNDVRDRLAPEAAGIFASKREDFAPEFFDLRTGLAGEIFQKCVNYRVSRFAIVLSEPGAATASGLRSSVYEHRTHPAIRFPIAGRGGGLASARWAERRGNAGFC